MKWERKTSKNFEDRRGTSTGGKAIMGGGIIGIVALLLTLFGGETGQVVGNILQQTQGGANNETVKTRELSSEEITLGQFSEAVFVYNNETWIEIFKENGQTYKEPGMVLFDDGVHTACGSATSAAGPFYCPGDYKVYMDLRFFEELHTRFGAKRGDFTIAYVIAHEVGHHVQTLVGINQKIRQAQQGVSKAQANKLSVAQELQADFYAGVWASRNKHLLEAGDIEEAISAAEAVGDDAIQSKMHGHVQPETFTHGTSAQRKYWFLKGYETGDIKVGDIDIIYKSL
ncbi:neutral zinc metallopeptidase [Capnocytophaga sp. ARDL2]|uniref:KPN_02809 family neutral zinc metallopeptidase n=1 Tax=Capnocytophaga sp. ARDL2 TaxID=3238809 RepID=UPI00355679C1